MGDDLEIKSIEFSGWQIENSKDKNILFTSHYEEQKIEVLKIYEF